MWTYGEAGESAESEAESSFTSRLKATTPPGRKMTDTSFMSWQSGQAQGREDEALAQLSHAMMHTKKQNPRLHPACTHKALQEPHESHRPRSSLPHKEGSRRR